MKKNDNITSFGAGLLVAFLVLNGFSNVRNTDQFTAIIGGAELLAAGLLTYPHLLNLWVSTGRALVVAIREAYRDVNKEKSE